MDWTWLKGTQCFVLSQLLGLGLKFNVQLISNSLGFAEADVS